MEKIETASLMKKIKTNYPEFVITDEEVDNWHEELKKYPYFDIEDKLKEYLKTDNDRPPRLNHLTNGVKTLVQKYDESNNYIVYCNLCNKKMTLREYNNHYGRCLQVQTLWRKSKNLGKEILREEIEQFGDDILDKLEEKYIGEATSIFTKI